VQRRARDLPQAPYLPHLLYLLYVPRGET